MIGRLLSKFKKKAKDTAKEPSIEAVEELPSGTEEDEGNKDNYPTFEVTFSSDEDGSNLNDLWLACNLAESKKKENQNEVRNLEESPMDGKAQGDTSLTSKLAAKSHREFLQ